MKAPPPPSPVRDPGREQLSLALTEQRQRVKEVLASQRERLRQLEATLVVEVRQQREELARQEDELRKRQAEVEAAQSQLHHDRRALELVGQEHRAELEHVAALRQKLDQRSAQLDASEQRLAQQQAETENQRRRIAEMLRRQRDAQYQEIADRRSEIDRLRETAALPAADASERENDLQRRLETALDDLRQAQARNDKLERKLAQGPAVQGGTPPALEWEDEKRRILAALEIADHVEEPGAAGVPRLEIQEIVRTTDQALAEKDREIDAIKQVLQAQSNNLEDVVVGAAAVGSILDQDALICEERTNLQRLQQRWEEMLRQAEIELSLERAKLARDRSAIDEKIHAYEEKLAVAPGNPTAAAKFPRGRWLARLGLKDGNTE
jgi:chromosome segregation ATPase